MSKTFNSKQNSSSVKRKPTKGGKESKRQRLYEEYYRKYGPLAENISVMFYNMKPQELDVEALEYLNANRDSYITRYKSKLKLKEKTEAEAKRKKELEMKVDLDKIMTEFEFLPVTEENYREYLRFRHQVYNSRKEVKEATLKIYGEDLLKRFRDAENYSAEKNKKKIAEKKNTVHNIQQNREKKSVIKQKVSQFLRESDLQTAMRKLRIDYANGVLENVDKKNSYRYTRAENIYNNVLTNLERMAVVKTFGSQLKDNIQIAKKIERRKRIQQIIDRAREENPKLSLSKPEFTLNDRLEQCAENRIEISPVSMAYLAGDMKLVENTIDALNECYEFHPELYLKGISWVCRGVKNVYCEDGDVEPYIVCENDSWHLSKPPFRFQAYSGTEYEAAQAYINLYGYVLFLSYEDVDRLKNADMQRFIKAERKRLYVYPDIVMLSKDHDFYGVHHPSEALMYQGGSKVLDVDEKYIDSYLRRLPHREEKIRVRGHLKYGKKK